MTDATRAQRKPMLLEVFKKFASAEMDNSLPAFLMAAQEGIQKGMTEDDVQWLQDLSQDGAAFKKEYGPNALTAEFTARMKAHDEKCVARGIGPRFPGFYPA